MDFFLTTCSVKSWNILISFSSGVTNHYLSAHRQRPGTASRETGFYPDQRHLASSRPQGVYLLGDKAPTHPTNSIEHSRQTSTVRPSSPPTPSQHLSSCPFLITRYKMISKIIASAFTMAFIHLLTIGKQISHLQSKRYPLIFIWHIRSLHRQVNLIQSLTSLPSIFQRHQNKGSMTPLLRPVPPTRWWTE